MIFARSSNYIRKQEAIARAGPFRGSRRELWHGQADVVAPVQMGRYLASEIPDCRLVEYPDEGHMIYVSHWAEILRVAAHRAAVRA